MAKIKTLSDLKSFCKKNVKHSVIGVGVTAFNRLGLEDVISDYKIISLRYGLDAEVIEKDIPVFSLEKGLGNKHLPVKKNATSILRDKRGQEYISSFKNPALIFYETTNEIEEIIRRKKWTLVANPKSLREKFENKVKFRDVLKKCGIDLIPSEINYLRNVNYSYLVKKYGKKFVIQLPDCGGGKGTFFINSKDEYREIVNSKKIKEYRDIKLNFASFITGPSPSITGCVTRQGILYTNPQYQVLDAPECFNLEKGSGLFSGHDWTKSNFPEKVARQAHEFTEKIGLYLRKFGYKGIFGLDMLLDQESQKLYVVECNPRLLGSFPVISMVQLKGGEIPLIALHTLEFLGIQYDLDLDSVNKLIKKKKVGTQLVLHNLEGIACKIMSKLKAGVYKFDGQKLKLDRPGYDLRHLKANDELLVSDGIPRYGSAIGPFGRLIRVITLREVLDGYKKLNPWASKVCKEVYKLMGLKPFSSFYRRKPTLKKNLNLDINGD
ncbi:hypothetical protein COY23_01100 [bacterium (Candidatus Torokbacteria) CG_4_10_14_0_2_um_filter_35_8]|nr:MAG: hypothetical protein COY23_01100 [bacterium (Candidatus Torokbacteria) CG_4_10_14_0_2_um_filter_35_8]